MATTSTRTWRSPGSPLASTPRRCTLPGLSRSSGRGLLRHHEINSQPTLLTKQPRSHNTSSPLFLLLAPQSAHTPLEAPDEYLDMFADISDHNRRVFSAMVAAMDVMVGRVIEALRESHLYENSLIVFVSDNGAASKQVIASQGSQDVKNLSTEYVGPA